MSSDTPTTIKCPGCEDGEIVFDAQLLLAGTRFTCNSCSASICLSDNSKSTLATGLLRLDQMKQNLGSLKTAASRPKMN
ncbi:hypothetical protein [Emcibacter sp.]|uniref:hypothetical protein n=1 Tax=Emcibacter sp. TaxID=1979954 RepID=UPI003A8FA56B